MIDGFLDSKMRNTACVNVTGPLGIITFNSLLLKHLINHPAHIKGHRIHTLSDVEKPVDAAKVVRPTMNSIVNMLLQHCSTVTTWNNMVDNLFIVGRTSRLSISTWNNLCVFSRVDYLSLQQL
jgi:hypothetical protein